jgi:hypothetical protein
MYNFYYSIIYETQQKIVNEKTYNEIFAIRKLHVLLVQFLRPGKWDKRYGYMYT